MFDALTASRRSSRFLSLYEAMKSWEGSWKAGCCSSGSYLKHNYLKIINLDKGKADLIEAKRYAIYGLDLH